MADTPEKTIVRPDTSKYTKAKAASGAITQHNGDAVAQAIEGATLDEVYGLTAEVLETSVSDLLAKYQHLNGGMQRMNLGNRIRGAVNKMNKAEGGSGDKYIAQLSTGVRQAVEARAEVAAAAKAAKPEATEDKPKRSKKAA
jgi:hypothetical protein